MLTTVTGKNQVTIPAKLAIAMAIEPGSQLEWRKGSQPGELRVMIRPSRAALARSLRGAGQRFLPGSAATAGLIEGRIVSPDADGRKETGA